MKINISLEKLSAIITWAIVAGISLNVMHSDPRFSYTHLLLTILAFCLYLIVWLFIASESQKIPEKLRKSAIPILFLIIIAMYFAVPYSFVAIYMVIFSAITPYYISIKNAFLLSPLWSLPQFVIYNYYWGEQGALITSLLFWTFNLFALVMVNSNVKERDAKLSAEFTTQQLLATQSLLNEAVKQDERVRIARNIHDLLGHHLTALAINLQVASHKSEGETKALIDQCHHLSKLLLSDVREAVSDIREKGTIDLKSSLEALMGNATQLETELHLDEMLEISDINLADCLIKIIQESLSNAMRHAKAKHFFVTIKKDSSCLELKIKNDGKMPGEIHSGNGLRGIVERCKEFSGHAEFRINKGWFISTIKICENNDD